MSGFYDENGAWRSGTVKGGGTSPAASEEAALDAARSTERVLAGQAKARVELPRLLKQHPALKVDVINPETGEHALAELARVYAVETLY
jgi:hypothetical protein